ncbi:membrane lipoprotein lipid attachment site-containing protein [Sutcliffiella horikoshii]|uniref:membrane lipoprotein lipid attachment site-containing protein n=1 Tax=Sutcliffiella horikoshii TaxID=79883 RepID=UPI001F190DB4|nr:membrane lipoprotein lipid attachment site-containing protein [Sutcliffiella horikoshii]MCG1022286.1 hypothetical protein [Sutcliffiella horikoshii]
MKKLFIAICLLSLLTACSSASDTTEEIIIVDSPSTSNGEPEENAKDGTLYNKKNNEEKNQN